MGVRGPVKPHADVHLQLKASEPPEEGLSCLLLARTLPVAESTLGPGGSLGSMPSRPSQPRLQLALHSAPA